MSTSVLGADYDNLIVKSKPLSPQILRACMGRVKDRVALPQINYAHLKQRQKRHASDIRCKEAT